MRTFAVIIIVLINIIVESPTSYHTAKSLLKNMLPYTHTHIHKLKQFYHASSKGTNTHNIDST